MLPISLLIGERSLLWACEGGQHPRAQARLRRQRDRSAGGLAGGPGRSPVAAWAVAGDAVRRPARAGGPWRAWPDPLRSGGLRAGPAGAVSVHRTCRVPWPPRLRGARQQWRRSSGPRRGAAARAADANVRVGHDVLAAGVPAPARRADRGRPGPGGPCSG